jgi:hypothetical protein
MWAIYDRAMETLIMCDSTTSYWFSGSYFSSDSTITEYYNDSPAPEIIPYKRKPHFHYNLKGWFNVKLAFYRYYELGLQKGIRLPRWTLRSKNSFV